ncbi:Vta1 like-domain-containing protein [Chaetomidium leptoderma]|uniref:Vta1 like-domain-containing protein n=1 Tax=Chaetomidium leptoderma TaxID=669021 RepID=A0AAN6VG68_9PEZI|nr:Vta1 like-domain-containing protein [Chaetomidium leptoderma]
MGQRKFQPGILPCSAKEHISQRAALAAEAGATCEIENQPERGSSARQAGLIAIGEYWAVNQILAKQLHTTDEGILRYTTNLMDKLEQTKTEYASEDAVTDDAAGQAYVEQFAQDTLDRAERVVKANRVTQQTATTFDAAATFFHVANVWGPVDQETQQKIKYAKWNAARIVKAIKEGNDPNESNPKHEEPPQPELDPNDPAVQSLGGALSNTGPRPATVEEVPDHELLKDAAGVSLPHTPVSAGPSPVSDGGLQLPAVPTDFGQPAQSSYFGPEATITPPPQHPGHFQAPPDLPEPPTGWTPSQQRPATGAPTPTTWSQPSVSPPPGAGFYHQPSAPTTIPPTFATTTPPVNPPTDPYRMHVAPTANVPRPAAPLAAPPVTYAPVQSGGPVVDEAAIVGAQKHAKWAISALNFEDVSTAARELRKALELLGAT